MMSNRTMRPSTLLLLAFAALGLSGCLRFSPFTHAARVTPVSPANVAVGDVTSAQDRLYARAVWAIESRDYGHALDILQLAKDANPDDPRVLTALGVVYDKLARFDLSARYYALAEKADPGSKIVAHDRGYSEFLQGHVGLAAVAAGPAAIAAMIPDRSPPDPPAVAVAAVTPTVERIVDGAPPRTVLDSAQGRWVAIQEPLNIPAVHVVAPPRLVNPTVMTAALASARPSVSQRVEHVTAPPMQLAFTPDRLGVAAVVRLDSAPLQLAISPPRAEPVATPVHRAGPAPAQLAFTASPVHVDAPAYPALPPPLTLATRGGGLVLTLSPRA